MLLLFFIIVWMLSQIISYYLTYSERRNRIGGNRIIPIDALTRISQFRTRINNHRYLLEQEKYNKVMAELKNKVIVINPDDALFIGIEYPSNEI